VRPDIPIVLMSGYGSAHLVERARAARVFDVLRKPLRRADVADIVARALELHADHEA